MLPGIGPAMAVALLLPVTYSARATQAFIMFAGIYYGGMYGGSTTSILLNTPGESASVMTALEGNKMAKTGRAAQALATAAIGSFVAGTIGTLLVAFFAPALADVAVDIGAPSYFAIMLLALVDGHRGARLLAGCAASSRCSSGSPSAWSAGPRHRPAAADASASRSSPTASTSWWSRSASSPSARPSGWPRTCGARPLEIIPVGRPVDGPRRLGALVEAVAARHRARLPVRRDPRRRCGDPDVPVLHHRAKLSKHRGEFGKGAIEGVAGPEAANNASAAGMFVPMLALGLPITATASVMLAAMQGYGIQPGPQLMTDQADLVWTLLASLLIGNILLLVLNLPLAPLWAKLLRIPRPHLYAGILFFASPRRLHRQPRPVRPLPAAGLRPARAWRCAASGCRCCR